MAGDESPLKGVRNFLWKLLLVIVVLGLLIATGAVDAVRNVIFPESPSMKSVALGEGTPIDRSFQLTNQNGETVGSDQYAAANWAVFFGFTHCPDVCPVGLSRLGHLWGQLKNQDRLQVFFVTVDPLRDTPEVLRDYMKAFDPRIMALTGSEVQIEQMKKHFNVYSKKVQEPGASTYSVDHTASIFLLRADGGFFGTIDVNDSDDIALAKLRRLVGD